MQWKFWNKNRRLQNLVTLEGHRSSAYLLASTEQTEMTAKETNIRKRLQEAKLIEVSVNPATAVKVTVGTIQGVKYPDDFNDFRDYLDAYYYIPYVARAVDIKQFMIWQMGYDLESEDDNSKKTIEDLLSKLQADTVIRDGTLHGLVFGNMYWQKIKPATLKPLNPMKMGIRANSNDEVMEYVYEPKFGQKQAIKPEDIVHLKVNAEPYTLFGVSCLRRVLPTVKALLFMEEKLPWIARRRADPLLAIQIGNREQPVDKETFDRIKNGILNRKPGEDIFHDGTLTIQEVFQAATMGGRQTLEPLLEHFTRNLVAGLGVPEPALGFGGTTTMATADYQERILEAEIRSYQRALKRLHETSIFSLADTHYPVKLVWRPLKEEDKITLSKSLQGEIEHGIISPHWARQRLGYPEDSGRGTVIDSRLAPAGMIAQAEKKQRKTLQSLRDAELAERDAD